MLCGGREGAGCEGVGAETSHPQFAHGGPEGLCERGMSRERPEVPAFLREREEQTHHQRRPQFLLGRVDAALDEERRAHEERDVERRDEPEVGPVGALEGQPVAEGPANDMRRDKDPFRSGRECPTERLQLVDKRIHGGSMRFSCASTIAPQGCVAATIPVSVLQLVHHRPDLMQRMLVSRSGTALVALYLRLEIVIVDLEREL